MRLIGMMDSPYVRRTAISLRLMGLEHEHEQISVFRHYDAFAAINPVVKAPTLVADDGTVLLDSQLILEYLERLAPAERRLTPVEPQDFLRSQRIIGLALAACEKSIQTYYELTLRPEDKQHLPWLERVKQQMHQAYALLEREVAGSKGWLFGARPLQADVTAAVAWRFTNFILPNAVSEADHPFLAQLSARAEALPEFQACPLS